MRNVISATICPRSLSLPISLLLFVITPILSLSSERYTSAGRLNHHHNRHKRSSHKAALASASEMQPRQHLVLIGGGHAHVQVIKSLNKYARPENIDVTLVDVQSSTVYSGMVPGCIAGLYGFQETLICLDVLAKWSGINFVNQKVIDVDPEACNVILEDGSEIRYDVLSIDIGSTSSGFAGVKGSEFAVPTRPIAGLVKKMDTYATVSQAEIQDVAIVGGGVAGIELAMSINSRLPRSRITILDSKTDVLPQESKECREALKGQLHSRNIRILSNSVVKSISDSFVELQNGDLVRMDRCIWATGAGSHILARRLNERGISCTPKTDWIRVSTTLQTISHENIFAAGDCCTIEGLPSGKQSPPKAGVYAVRAGPVLIENLTLLLERYSRRLGGSNYKRDTRTTMPRDENFSSSMTEYYPQDDFLKLIVCGDGTALGFRFGRAFYGKWVWHLKDYIDRNFMQLFAEENLPDCSCEDHPICKPKSSYDNSQYDAKLSMYDPIEPEEASELLARTDDSLDPSLAWSLLRNMTLDEGYRTKVLHGMSSLQMTRLT
mmetsp:Transcript_34366/g.49916  ORF Transcript_34366/g.49916 Transcript_34366/m.49916 type:complete len:551 (-) Transcript_34366:24-1676(-)